MKALLGRSTDGSIRSGFRLRKASRISTLGRRRGEPTFWFCSRTHPEKHNSVQDSSAGTTTIQRRTTPLLLPKPVVSPTPGPCTGMSCPGGLQTQPFHHGLWLPKHAGPLPCWPSSWNCWSPGPRWFSSWGNRRKRLGPSCCSRPLLSSRGCLLLRRPTRVRSPITRQMQPRADPTKNCCRKPSRGRQRGPEQRCVRTAVQAAPRSVIPDDELFEKMSCSTWRRL